MGRSASSDSSLVAASEAGERSEAQLRLLEQQITEYAIFLLDPSGYVTTWNAGAERIKGYRADEIIGQHFSRFDREKNVREAKCERELEIAVREGWVGDEDSSRAFQVF